MCGGDLNVQDGATTCFCEFCGTQQTIPSNKDENLQRLFNRANVLRMKSEFDKASDIYEKILQADETEAEAYWGLILCKYGIEYVEDPATSKRIPTCHRASYDPVRTDEDYKNALKYADVVQRKVYEAEAAKIDEVQKGIQTLAQKESPFDVFICYKETDDSGNRTQDSVIANDIYYQLTHEGFKVFYAAISLEDKLGSEYEPVIFSALNTAKVMLVLGTKPEYFNAVWVKNEWSRFLKIIQKDRTKMMIPCYKDMDPYELPDEFAHLQSQNMDKIGFINDLVRGIKKVCNHVSGKENLPGSQSKPIPQVINTDKLMVRGRMSLEDKEWEAADALFEQILSMDPYCAPAYYGKFLAKYHIWDDQSQYDYLSAKNKGIKPRIVKIDIPAEHKINMANRYAVPGVLPPERIMDHYIYSSRYHDETEYYSTYEDEVENIKYQAQTILSDRLLARAVQYADNELKYQINRLTLSIQQKSNELIQKAKAADDETKRVAYDKFNIYLKSVDQQIVSMNKGAQKECESRKEEEKKAKRKKREDRFFYLIKVFLFFFIPYIFFRLLRKASHPGLTFLWCILFGLSITLDLCFLGNLIRELSDLFGKK